MMDPTLARVSTTHSTIKSVSLKGDGAMVVQLEGPLNLDVMGHLAGHIGSCMEVQFQALQVEIPESNNDTSNESSDEEQLDLADVSDDTATEETQEETEETEPAEV